MEFDALSEFSYPGLRIRRRLESFGQFGNSLSLGINFDHCILNSALIHSNHVMVTVET